MNKQNDLLLENQLLQADRQALYAIVSKTKLRIKNSPEYKRLEKVQEYNDKQYVKMAIELDRARSENEQLLNLVWLYQTGKT